VSTLVSAKSSSMPGVSSYFGILRRRWRTLAVVVPPVVLAAAVLAFALPAIYASTATILLEASSIDPSLIKTTVVSYADQQIELVRRDVMSGGRLERIVGEIDPYPERPDLSARDKAVMISNDTTIQKVDPVTLEPLVISSAFSLKYRNRSPTVASEVTQRLADLFLTANREARTAQADDAYNFLLGRAKALEDQIRSVEQRVAEFKGRYGNALPEATGRNESALDRAERELDAVRTEIRLVEQQESLLKLQLGQMSPTLITSKGSDLFTQLGTLRAQLAEAQQKYTPDHPDVKRLTRAIEALAAQAKLGNTPNVRPDNPDYMRVSAELDAVQKNLAALRSKSWRAESQIGQYEQRLTQTPRVERDYVQLTRDREILQQQFESTQTKLREAEMTRSLESQAKGERYTLIRRPYAAGSPESPNRLGIILLGMVLGLGLAVGLAAFKEATDPTVRHMEDVAAIAGLPVLAAVPTLLTAERRHRQRVIWSSLAGGYVAVAALVTVVVVLFR
jgi:succinoglycan biosynthesis transport protein ExoP